MSRRNNRAQTADEGRKGLLVIPSLGSRQKLLGALAITFLVAAAAGAAVSGPTVLAPLSGDFEAEALDISDSGRTVGYSGNFTSYPYTWWYSPVIWDKDGEPEALPFPDACPALFPFPQPLGDAESVNNKGEAVGLCYGDGFRLVAVRWDKRGNPTVIPPLSGDDSAFAPRINEKGEAAGWSWDSSVGGASNTAVVWNAAGTPTALPPLAGDSVALARDVNNNGIAIGKSGLPSVPPNIETAVVWDRNGLAMALPPLPGHNASSGWRINERGEMLGVSYNDGGPPTTPVKWDSDGNPTAIGPPADTRTLALNDRGQAAGFVIDPIPTATFWGANGTATALPALGGDVATHAHGLNNRGQVAGGSFGALSSAVIWRVTNGRAGAASAPTSVAAGATPARTRIRNTLRQQFLIELAGH